MEPKDLQQIQATVLQLQSQLDLVMNPDVSAVRSTGSCTTNSCNTTNPPKIASAG